MKPSCLKTTICHVSDTHCTLDDLLDPGQLPSADVYVITGDFLSDTLDGCRDLPTAEQHSIQREYQTDLLHLAGGPGCMRDRFGIGDRPVVVVRGNHDFIDLAPFFAGGPVFEIKSPWQTGSFAGLTFSGFRGVGPIDGRYSDELDPVTSSALFDLNVPEFVDVLVTHSPPHGILDQYREDELSDPIHIGIPGIGSLINSRMYTDRPIRAHLFGHAHSQRGQLQLGGCQFSNAATTINMLEL